MAIRLTHLARQDLENIRRYTVETWGRSQWLQYYRGLAKTFEHIQANPDQGRNRDLFTRGMLSVNYEKHIVFYKPIKAANNDPVVLRILHQKRNLPALVYYEDLDGP